MRFLTHLAAWTCFFCKATNTGAGRCTSCGT